MQIQSVTANLEITNAQVVRALVQRALNKFEPKPNSRFADWAGKFNVRFSKASQANCLRADLWITTGNTIQFGGCVILEPSE